MWFKLASATFTTHLGKMSELSNTVRVNLDASGFTVAGDALSFDKEGSNQRRTYTLTLKSNYEIQNTVTPTVNSGNATATVSGGTGGVYTLVVTAATAPTSEVKITVSGAVYVGTDLPDIPDPEEPDTPVNPPSDNPTTPNTITWELGAINSGGGPNSTDMPKQRIRTAGYLQVESSITIKATGNVEFCPVYYRTDKTYISSPNKYQTTDCVVNASEYPLVRLMIRDKTSTSADLTSKLTELGNSIIITGNFVEVPYASGDEPDEPETPTRNIPPLADTATWYVGALNSNNGEITTMTTRLYSNRFALTSSPMTITVSGNAEICPVWYKSDGSFKSSPAAYQTTSITTTSTDGHSVAFMIRDKSNTNATLTTSFGSNVTISK